MSTIMRRKKRTFVMVITALVFWLIHFRFCTLSLVKVEINDTTRFYPTIQRHYHHATKSCPLNKDKKIFAALLSYWDSLSKRHNISYVIGLGSLLGQYRSQDIIPWDDDVDVLVNIEYFKTLKSLGEERNFKQGWDRKFHVVIQPDFDLREERRRRRWSCTGKQVFFQVDRCSFVSPMARVIQGYRALDVFPYIVNDNTVRDVELKRNYNRTHFFPFNRCKFMNVSTWCPGNIRGVLESAYDDMTPEYVCRNGKWVFRGNNTLFEINGAIKYLKNLITRLFEIFR